MVDTDATLRQFYTSWKEYQDHLAAAIAPLTAEHLALRAGPDLRTIDDLTRHIIGGRAVWFSEFLGEESTDMRTLATWEAHDAAARTAGELVWGLTTTWEFMAACLARWTPDDMAKTFPHIWHSTHYELSRSWVVWHVLEYDLHHGGEVSLTLGMHGLEAPDV